MNPLNRHRPYDVYDQRRVRTACTSAQSDQGLQCSLVKSFKIIHYVITQCRYRIKQRGYFIRSVFSWEKLSNFSFCSFVSFPFKTILTMSPRMEGLILHAHFLLSPIFQGEK